MFLSINEIAEKYHLSRRIIDAGINSGELVSYCFVGKKRLIKETDLKAWFERKKYTPVSQIPLIRFKNYK